MNNSTGYGLASYIFSSNKDEKRKLIRYLQCGRIWINSALEWNPALPVGGYNNSGNGRDMGIEGFLIYGGISLVAGGILWLIAGPDANTADGSAAPALAGFLLIAGSPIAGIYGAMANWSVPAKKGFDIYKGAWEFDIDSMAPNSKSVEQN